MAGRVLRPPARQEVGKSVCELVLTLLQAAAELRVTRLSASERDGQGVVWCVVWCGGQLW